MDILKISTEVFNVAGHYYRTGDKKIPNEIDAWTF
jgi:hypothetical protein